MREKCHNHPQRNALNFCHSCGRYFCSECLTEGETYYYCHSEECQSFLQSELKQVEVNKPLIPYASQDRRFVNHVVDGVVMVPATLLAAFLTDSIVGSTGMALLFAPAAVFFFYYFIFEVALQRTPAKFITGTKVIMPDGTKPSISAFSKRTLCRFVPFEPLSGIHKGIWWHDRWSGTQVVRIRDMVVTKNT